MKVDTMNQNFAFLLGLNFEDLIFFVFIGKVRIIIIAITKASTPPNLLGIDRRMAYANRKYHSGWIWIGVFKGLAGLKFSGSPILLGNNNTIKMKNIKNVIAPSVSLILKNGWKEILSKFEFNPVGEFDPVICNEVKWMIITEAKIMGRMKCIIKNRFKVAFLMENPPHTHSTMVFPAYGMADIKLVITVAPQNDICPQGKTYPTKAVPISRNKIITPDTHVLRNLCEENKIPRLMWM
jgi:hypothetical protein